MALRSTSFCVVLLFVHLGCCARNRDGRQDTIQNNIDYTAQFANQRNSPPPQPQLEPVPVETGGQLEDDPLVRTLFKEFLVQYQQLAQEQKTRTEAPPTPIRTENPFQPAQIPLFTSPPLEPTFPSFPQTTPVPQRRRLSPRRRTTTPAPRVSFNPAITSTTPFSPLLNRVNSLHHKTIESTTPFLQRNTLEPTTPFPALRQRFFAVETSKPRKQQPFVEPKTARTPLFRPIITPSPEILQEELPLTTQQPKPLPNFNIPQQRLVTIPPRQSVNPSKVQTPSKKTVEDKFDEAEFRRQAESAKYEFASDVNDEINGNINQREEVRDGLAVKGRYSFSDGFYKRTINYEADEKGYRVVKEEVEPLEGPQTNPDGQARVSSYIAGKNVNYQITKDDIMERNQKTTFQATDNDYEDA